MVEERPASSETVAARAACPESEKAARRDSGFFQGLSGAVTGLFCGWLFTEVSFVADRAGLIVLGFAILFGALALTRLAWIVRLSGIVAAVGLLLIAFTPLVPWLVRSPIPSDALERSDAVVSLGAGVNSDGTLSYATQDRVLHAMALVHAGYAPCLVLTGGEALGESVVRRQMNELGLKLTIENTGPVTNTHDEAIAVSQLARQRGWRRVILVTNAWHMRRAAAAFEKSGVRILRSPCVDSGGDMFHPSRLHDRMRALACWLHEAAGYTVYRYRGWI